MAKTHTEPRKTSHNCKIMRRFGSRGKHCRVTHEIHFWDPELMKQRRYNPQQEAKSLERSYINEKMVNIEDRCILYTKYNDNIEYNFYKY